MLSEVKPDIFRFSTPPSIRLSMVELKGKARTGQHRKKQGYSLFLSATSLYLRADAAKGRADALAFVKYNVELATALGAKHICSGEGAFPPGVDRDEIWNRLITTLREAVPICESHGIIFNLEPHPGYIMADESDRARELIEEIGSASIRICLDFCHANVITKGNPVSMIEKWAGIVGTMHISDGIQVPQSASPNRARRNRC